MNTINKINVNGVSYSIGATVDTSTLMKKAVDLPAKPTTSTLAYNDYTFIPGDIVRVADSTSLTGYSFYRLHTVENNEAVWAKLDTGTLNLVEVVTVNFATNQNDTTELVNVATATLSYGTTTETKTFTGSALEFEIPEDTAYTITFGSVAGYSTPSVYSRTSELAGRPTTTATYNTEVVSVSSQLEDSTTINPTYTLVVDGNTITNPTFPYKVAYGVSYTITPGDWDGYTTPSAYTKVAADNTQSVVFTYEEIKNGVFIYTTSGQLVNPDSWTGSTSDTVGVAVITDVCSFVIGKTNLGYKYWDNSYSSNGVISGVTATDSTNTAKVDYNGVANTNAMRQKSSGCEAAKACYNSTVTINGSTAHGYLGGCGEWWQAYQNKAAVDSAMSKCGGTAIPTNDYHWTSTQYQTGYYYAWYLGWNDGNVRSSSKTVGDYVRPFYALA